MYNFNFNESDMLSKSQNENILDELEAEDNKEDLDFGDFVQQAIASGDFETLILINEIEVEDEKDEEDNQEIVEDDESFSIVEKDGQKWKVLSTAKGKYNAARKYNECITTTKNEVRLVSLKDLEKMNESRKNEAPANSESLFTALMSELNTIYKCDITDEGFLRCTDDGGNFIEIATIKNTDPVEMGMKVTFTDGTQSETVYYVYDNIQAVNDFIQAVFISEVNAYNDMNEVEAEEVQTEEKEDVELEDENQAQEEIDKNVEEVEEESEEEKTESLNRNKNEEKTINNIIQDVIATISKYYTRSELKYSVDPIIDEFNNRGVKLTDDQISKIVLLLERTNKKTIDILKEVLAPDSIGSSKKESSKRNLNEDVIPAVYDSLIIRYKDMHNEEDFNEIVNILKNLRKTATFITNNDIKEELEGWRYSEEDIDKIINAIKINESDEVPEKLKKIEDEVRAEIEKIYGDDKDLMEYFFVESEVRKGYYDDGSDMNVIEVRAELDYDSMTELAEKLDPIVQKYDKYSYFEQVDGGIMHAVINFDRKYESHKNETVDEYKEYHFTFTKDHEGNVFINADDYAGEYKEWQNEEEDEEMENVIDIAKDETIKFDIEKMEGRDILYIDIIDFDYDEEDAAGSFTLGVTFEDDINESLNENDNKFDYMMLDRLRTDCDYFLGNGDGCEKHLWAGNVEDQIAEMRKIYDKLPEKPEWLSIEEIDKYEKDMLAKRDSKDESLNEELKKPYRVITDGAGGKSLEFQYDTLEKAKKDAEKFRKTGTARITYSFEDENGQIQTKEIDESLNEDGTVADMGVAPILPAGYDDIDNADDVVDELFNIEEGFLFPDSDEETDEDKEEEVNSLMGAAIEDIKQGEPTASEWIEDAQYVFNSIKDDTVKNRLRDKYSQYLESKKNESSQNNEASAELNKVIKDLAANDKTDVDKEINKLYKTEPDVKSKVADGSPILGATSPDNIVPTIDKAIMNKAIFAATSYANNGPQMFAKLQESFKNIDRKTLDDLMNSKDVAGIAKYLYESEIKDNKNEDTFTDPQMNVVNSNSSTVATGNSPETPKLADDIDPAPTEVQDLPKDKSEIENTNADNNNDQLAKDSDTEDIPTI